MLELIRLADTLKQVHQLPPPHSTESADFDPFTGLARGIASAPGLDIEDRRWLHGYLAELQGRWNGLPEGRSRCLIHGATRIDGVLTGDDDCATPLHSEPATLGPPEWDLVPIAMAYWSFGWLNTSQYTTFCQTYGQDVARCGRFYLLRDIQEFAMTIAAIQPTTRQPTQATRRLACIRGDIGPRPWPGWLPINS